MVESVHGLPPLLAGGMEVALVPPALKTSRYHTVARADAQGGPAQLVAFEDVASLSEAAELVGRTVLARLDDLPATVALMDREALVGTCVRDRTLGLLGTITEVMAGPAQDVYVLDRGGAEVLVPVLPEFVVGRGDDGCVLLDLPEGAVALEGE
ncbi:MAG: 16S rRNA-processing protein [Coriobacteriaceae bacterium]|nr:16S rRNA-processing protein [Coriobacteriaceae bacterium]